MTYNYETIASLLVIIGAINWGLVAYNPEYDAVKLIKNQNVEKYTKFIIGASGLYLLFRFIKKNNKMSS